MTDKKRKLRNYLLNARFQLPFTLVVVGIAAGLTAGLGYFWYQQARSTSAVIEARSLGAPATKEECRELCDTPGATLTDEQLRQIRRDLAAQDRLRLWILIGFGIAFSLLLAGYGIISTHKVAGPLFKIQRHMRDIAEGRLFPMWGLRRGDQLQDFWATFRDMHQTLRQRSKQDRNVMRRIVEATSTEELDSARARMRELLEEKERLLGPDDTEIGPLPRA